MTRFLTFLYGVVAYLVFFGSFLYAIGFVGNLWVPKSVDSGIAGPWAEAFWIHTLLLGLFAVQHSVMARQGFKRWWTKVVPKSIERSTYVFLASLLLILLFWQWRPMLGVVWEVNHPLGRLGLQGLFWVGWGMVLLATGMINHFDLFGLRQVTLAALGKAYTPIGFKAPALYQVVRHPMMLGFLIAFWATPRMTVGHLLFSSATTAYVLIGIFLEERDLVRFHGPAYQRYREQVAMLIPVPKKR